METPTLVHLPHHHRINDIHCGHGCEEGICTDVSCDGSASTTTSSMISVEGTLPVRPTSASTPELASESCDACQHCNDVCCTDFETRCSSCSRKAVLWKHENNFETQQQQRQQKRNNCKNSNSILLPITKCQLCRHNNAQDGIWLLCKNSIYDVTNYIQHHPGGINSIKRKSGGVIDVTRDMSFHSPQANKLMNKMKIGYLVPCVPKVRVVDEGRSDFFISSTSTSTSNNRSTDSPWKINDSNHESEILEQSEQCVIC
jgi:cytochrome b involved in lipid metabolism